MTISNSSVLKEYNLFKENTKFKVKQIPKQKAIIINFGAALQYISLDYNISLFFPILYVKGQETVQSPITGLVVKNNSGMPLQDLICYHIKKHAKKGQINKLPYWTLYLESKRYYGNISYKKFIADYLLDFANFGYSEVLINPINGD